MSKPLVSVRVRDREELSAIKAGGKVRFVLDNGRHQLLIVNEDEFTKARREMLDEFLHTESPSRAQESADEEMAQRYISEELLDPVQEKVLEFVREILKVTRQ